MNTELKNAISHNWNNMEESEIQKVVEKIYANDGTSVYNSTYNRWYFYKHCDKSFRVSRLTWDNDQTKGLETFDDLLKWLDWYFS